MRAILFLMIFIFSCGIYAEECSVSFSEPNLISSIGISPVFNKVIKDDGVTKKQYQFRPELSDEQAFSEQSDKLYEPQFYLSIYEPACSKRVMIWFYEDNKNTDKLSNVILAGRAFKYLTGVGEAVFENKLKRLSSVQSFESYDNGKYSRFLKTGDIYSIDVYLK